MIEITSSGSNELLNYTSYIAIKKFQKKTDRLPSGLFFNKIMSLAHKQLKEKGIDIGLPHYWYRYGDQVHKREMPKAITWNHESPIKTTVEWSSVKPDFYNDSTYRLINKTVAEVVERYAGNRKAIIQEVYSYAPYDFQREILALRSIINGWRNALNWDTNSYKTISKKVIIDALSKFPEDDFSEIKEEFQLTRELVKSILKDDDWSFELFQYICKEFWFYFCYHLRLRKNARENIPKGVVSYWEGRLDFEKDRFRRVLGDIIIQVNRSQPNIKKDPLIEREYIWRIKDLEETTMLINEFFDDT